MDPDDSDPELQELRKSHMSMIKDFVSHFFPSGTKVDLLAAYRDHGMGRFSSDFLKEIDSDPEAAPLPKHLREVLTHAANVYEVLGT